MHTRLVNFFLHLVFYSLNAARGPVRFHKSCEDYVIEDVNRHTMQSKKLMRNLCLIALLHFPFFACSIPVKSQAEQLTLPIYRSVAEFGDVGTSDDSATFQAAIDGADHIAIPPGTYYVKNLAPRSGITITASRGARIRGVKTSDTIFRTNRSIYSVTIDGGQWGNAEYVWHHTGAASVNSSKFSNMRLKDVDTAGFSFSSSIGNHWRDCSFMRIGYGILFTGDGNGQTNANWIENSKFMFYRINAIHFADTKIAKMANFILKSWFEEGEGTAIYVGGGITNLKIADSYFEETGWFDQPDIDIDQNHGANITVVLIENNHFAPTWKGSGQIYRIRNRGHSGFVARNNSVVLRDGQIFSFIEGRVNRSVNLVGNFLNAVGGGTYESRLYHQQGRQALIWSPYPGSGFVSEDEVEQLRYINSPALD